MFWKKMTISLILVLALGPAAEVANADFTFGEPINLGPTVNSSSWDNGPNISADGSTLYFNSGRPGGSGDCDLWQVKITSLLGSLQTGGDVETVQKLLENGNGKEVVPVEN